MVTWRDVERVHKAHPKWAANQIAKALGCGSAYVRATANRRGWDVTKHRKPAKNSVVLIPRETLRPLLRKNEKPHDCLKRLVNDALARAA